MLYLFQVHMKWFSYTYIIFQILSHMLLQSIGQSSLCHAVGPCWLSIRCYFKWNCFCNFLFRLFWRHTCDLSLYWKTKMQSRNPRQHCEFGSWKVTCKTPVSRLPSCEHTQKFCSPWKKLENECIFVYFKFRQHI